MLCGAYVNSRHDDWGKYLIDIEVAYNSALHSNTCFSPFYLNYGIEPKTIPIDVVMSHEHRSSDFLKNIQYATKCAQQNISKFNEYMASYATIKRTSCSIQFGDLVFLSAKIFLKDFLGQATKLLPKFSGPYEVGDKINKVTFPIDLETVLLGRGVHSAFYSSFYDRINQDTDT